MGNPYQEWITAFRESIAESGSLPIACDWLEDRELNSRPFRHYIDMLAAPDIQTFVRMSQELPALNVEWAEASGIPRLQPNRIVCRGMQLAVPCGPFYTHCTGGSKAIYDHLEVLSQNPLQHLTVQNTDHSFFLGIIGNYRLDCLQSLTLAQPFAADIAKVNGPSLKRLSVNQMRPDRTFSLRTHFMTNKRIAKGCELISTGAKCVKTF